MDRSRPLDEKVALITGATTGIGRATGSRLAADGASVALAARREDRLAAVAEEIEDAHDVSAMPVPTDVRDPAAVAEMVESTVDTFGGLDVLVNNAGLPSPGFDERFEDAPIEEYVTTLETNVNGMLYTTHAGLPALRESKGNLVFVGSSAGKLPRPATPLYAATKWWTRGFALSIEGHVGRDGVAVTLVNPTAVRTGRWSDLEPGQAAEPEEVADVIALAARQKPHTTLSEVDLFRRDLLGKFLPSDVDLELAFDPDRDTRG